ncbi:hypothetical protein LIER_05400 [Lithospermum erythrorhizon]|uniref:Uncharacterized protein n=1 Tax=Lithospermum erythrorhizon TaxID=34254 RepID=A0AAV3P1B4_LITER
MDSGVCEVLLGSEGVLAVSSAAGTAGHRGRPATLSVRDLPRTPGGKGYTIVAVDYFTKGVEAKPYPAGSGSGVPVFNGDLHPVWGIPSAGRR